MSKAFEVLRVEYDPASGDFQVHASKTHKMFRGRAMQAVVKHLVTALLKDFSQNYPGDPVPELPEAQRVLLKSITTGIRALNVLPLDETPTAPPSQPCTPRDLRP